MNKNQRINSFIALGQEIQRFILHPDESLLLKIRKENPWFIKEFVINAMKGITMLLQEKPINDWLNAYDLKGDQQKSVGIVMPGNIPLAGFHDLMCVLFSGYKAIIKPSHSDNILINFITDKLTAINKDFGSMIDRSGDFHAADAIIATGSDNTARYFKYNFRNKPSIIRQNRTSCAILNGEESDEDLTDLANDIFLYFGLGCRNVSKIYIPGTYNVESLIPYFSGYEWVKSHNKYFNNYLYRKGLARISSTSSIDTGFFHFENSRKIVSPISVIYFEKYNTEIELNSSIEQYSGKIQCIVTCTPGDLKSIKFGKAQYPGPSDYADDIDTLEFLDTLVDQ